MSLKSALSFLLQNLGYGKRSVIVSFQQMLMWGNGVLPILLDEGLLVEAKPAKSLPCKCGDKNCLMSVLSADLVDEVTGRAAGAVYYGMCGKSHSYIDILTKFDLCYLKQWQLTNQMLIDWFTKYLRLEPPREANRTGVIQIGTLTLNSENYALGLGTSAELAVLVNGDAVLMSELLIVSEGGTIEVNTSLIENAHCDHNVLIPKNPNKAKRNTQIFKKYCEIKTQFPNLKSDNDVIIQIVKDKALVGNLTSDTIRRILCDHA